MIATVPMNSFVLDLLLVGADRRNDIDAMFVPTAVAATSEPDWKVRIVELNPFAGFVSQCVSLYFQLKNNLCQ